MREVSLDLDHAKVRNDAEPRSAAPPDVNPPAMFEELLSRVSEYNPTANLELLRKAYRVASEAHGAQTRKSGEPYIVHPIEVARILTVLRMDTASVAAALLHDTVEDTALTIDQTRDMFGSEVAQLVDGVTKLTAISDGKPHADGKDPIHSKADAQAENLRKILLAMAKDIRVILIKLADRLHNLRTLGSLREEKQKRIAQESLEIFAPIASRLGIWKLKWEIEDLAFMYLMPEEYKQTADLVSKLRREREKIIPTVLEALKEKLADLNIKAHLEWRPKHFYSVYLKMSGKHKGLDEIYDLIAVRVIVDTQEECYTALGAVHSLWMPIKDRIKDYIAVPKSNHYRSLHTTVFGPGDEPLEIQIRTWEMHKVNDYGIAAHWAYKEGKEYNKEVNLAREIYPWVRLILDWQDESKDAKEYVENLKLDVLSSEVFVFTPNGDVLDLPAGSTPLDFAYRVHTDVGHRCVGAKVNTRLVPLEYQLQNGDIIEIMTSKHSTPSRDWLKICKSSHARNKIRLWFKKERREENVTRGKDLLEKDLRRHRIEPLMSDTALLLRVAAQYNLNTVDDLLAALGYSEIHTAQVIDRIKE
ncbi:MAG TPA: bifunctional (p)ppGpp synthetase/guanosine-3',5'-bis(diphosphate) 3'-pyrophosphohydrolase, partial [Candidatus Xenobia bacterium]